ncbi:MAG TPA: S8 family serine peptidase, partial [Vicinamibacterales bacterium]
MHASHPHVNGVSGGVGIDVDGRLHDDYVDRLGHGTAVVAAIKDLAPDVEIFAVRVFDRQLSTSIGCLVRAIEWSADAGVHVVNLSLGTSRREHEPALRRAIDMAAAHGTLIVAAREDEAVTYLPGSMAGALPVELDWSCARGALRIVDVNGVSVVRTSGLPRQIPGVPAGKNLHGVSFAVANTTALVARAMEGAPDRSLAAVMQRLAERA